MSFPWSTAITAVSTLAAGWGGISLKDWHDARRARQDRSRAAYLELMLRLDDLRRIFSAPLTVDEQAVGKAVGQAVGETQRAYFSVFLAAPASVQEPAGAAWNAAWDVYDWLDSSGQETAGMARVAELTRRLESLGMKSKAFAAAVQAAERGRLPAPRTGAESGHPAASRNRPGPA